MQIVFGNSVLKNVVLETKRVDLEGPVNKRTTGLMTDFIDLVSEKFCCRFCPC